ncbi:MAG: DUF4032 domain-containing protein [Opitutales bacterium]|nr:DUF4032 domain-containing protein [Opitutales bacterium]
MKPRRASGSPKSAQALRSPRLVQTVAAKSSLYREAAAEREEIMRHKWFLSEHAGYDVGYVHAMYDWIAKHRAGWRKSWRKKNLSEAPLPV